MEERSHRRIILAEDDPASRVLLARQLKKAGYEVVACSNGKEALDAICQDGHGFIITDWMMSEMDGIELCRRVREQQEMQALGIAHIILLTAHSDKLQVVTGLEAGADDYLTKPYNPQELLARIQVGERILRLQEQALHSQLEVHKINAQLAILNQKLDRLANSDALTGLANRRWVLERFQEIWALAERHHRPLSCLMLDLDRFKQINDTYGHKAGDLVLVHTAETIRRLVRRSDFCGRFGGEEFLVICPETPAAGAALLAERIRDAIAHLEIDCSETAVQATASVGAAEKQVAHQTADALIVEADAMLYEAKNHGRNQVWVSGAEGGRHPLTTALVTPA